MKRPDSTRFGRLAARTAVGSRAAAEAVAVEADRDHLRRRLIGATKGLRTRRGVTVNGTRNLIMGNGRFFGIARLPWSQSEGSSMGFQRRGLRSGSQRPRRRDSGHAADTMR